jgi:putative membrane protein
MLPEEAEPFAFRKGGSLQSAVNMLWLKAFHVVFVVTWFAGLFYLPRLFIYHLATPESAGRARFEVMERRLYAIMTIGAAGTLLFGLAMIAAAPVYLGLGWLRVKLVLVLALIGYHLWCRRLMRELAAGHGRSDRWYRFFNEVPGLLLIAIVILAVVKP